jgi:hypothetical protein
MVEAAPPPAHAAMGTGPWNDTRRTAGTVNAAAGIALAVTGAAYAAPGP